MYWKWLVIIQLYMCKKTLSKTDGRASLSLLDHNEPQTIVSLLFGIHFRSIEKY